MSPDGDPGMPLPFNRNLRFDNVFGGILRSNIQFGVGILTFAPRAASQGATGKSK